MAADGDVAMADAPARSFSDYFEHIQDATGAYQCLGAGNFGSVFVCRRKDSGPDAATFAVKHIKTTRSAAHDHVFARDVGLMARLNAAIEHPHIIGYRDGFLYEDAEGCIVSVVMELSPIAAPFPVVPTVASIRGLISAGAVAVRTTGKEANCDLTKSGVVTPPVPLVAAKSIMKQMLSALGYMHSCGIIHRDIKPDNVLVFGRAEVDGVAIPLCKLSDFGLSRPVDIDMTSNLGTAAFMAPEQTTRRYDAKVDIFGVGTTLYAIVACHHPFAKPDSIRKAFPDRFHPVMLARHFPPGSPQRDFLELLTQAEPARRPTALEALAHPFMADAQDPWMLA